MGTAGERVVVTEELDSRPLADKTVRRIVNMHIQTRPGRDAWRIKQCLGELSGGERVWVILPQVELPREGFNPAVFAMFSGEKRYAKIMDMFKPGVLSKEW